MPQPISAACATGCFPASAARTRTGPTYASSGASERCGIGGIEDHVGSRDVWRTDVALQAGPGMLQILPEGLTWDSLSAYTCLSKVRHKATSTMRRQHRRTSSMDADLARNNEIKSRGVLGSGITYEVYLENHAPIAVLAGDDAGSRRCRGPGLLVPACAGHLDSGGGGADAATERDATCWTSCSVQYAPARTSYGGTRRSRRRAACRVLETRSV
ncbi:hypothetical protein BDU57DRAFT_530977 [Ampelomyces quisqualis]|uniref:Uncharacterized protein n=1 Tax=Ampelomyces quisqualis TaxID=50730 RepID=A0A6A5QG29_AMPQU|nr:hypothetical protein BDU57DRAFT_530977 [Ampelomyces quisqualis]